MTESNNINKIRKKTLICQFCSNYQDELRDILNLKDKYNKPQKCGIGICSISKNVITSTSGFGCQDFDRIKFDINIKEIEE